MFQDISNSGVINDTGYIDPNYTYRSYIRTILYSESVQTTKSLNVENSAPNPSSNWRFRVLKILNNKIKTPIKLSKESNISSSHISEVIKDLNKIIRD